MNDARTTTLPGRPDGTLHRDEVAGVHRVEHAYVNWFLVESEGAVIVVDAGHPSSFALLEPAVRAIGRSMGDVVALVLTHGHFDHVGFALRAQASLGLRVHAPEPELGIVRNPWRYPHERSLVRHVATHPQFLRVFATMGLAGAPAVRGVDHVRPFMDGETLELPGRPRAIATPGHTPGHCALHLPDHRALIAGDALVTWNPYTLLGGPQIVSRAATGSSFQALASLDRLRDVDADVLLTGHGPAWRNGIAAAVDQAIARGVT